MAIIRRYGHQQKLCASRNNLAYNYVQYGGNLDVALGLAQKAREVNSTDAGIADTLGLDSLQETKPTPQRLSC